MIKTRTETVIDLNDWNALVSDTYKRIYNFQQQDGCKGRELFAFTVPDFSEDYENETVPEEVNHEEMGVSFEAWLRRDPTKPLNADDASYCLAMWWERNFYPEFQMVANDLHSKGLLEAGSYNIDIDW